VRLATTRRGDRGTSSAPRGGTWRHRAPHGAAGLLIGGWLAAHYLIVPNLGGQHDQTCYVTGSTQTAHHYGLWGTVYTYRVTTAGCGSFDATHDAATGVAFLGPGSYDLTITGLRSPATLNDPTVQQAAYLFNPATTAR
jgi:hypothetical protein